MHSRIPRVWCKQFPMKLMEGYLGRRTLPTADTVLVRAPNLIPPLVELGGDKKRMVVTLLESGTSRSERLMQDLSFRSTARRLASDPLPRKAKPAEGPQHLIDAAPSILRAFPNATFLFVGPEQSGYGETLRSQAAELGVASHCKFLGPIYDFEEKMQAYSSCQVFVLPTTYEGTSQAIFEAMGKPVVATRVGGIPYQITDGIEGYLVDYGDSAQLAAKIIEVLRNPDLAAEMGRKGKERVRANRYSVLASTLVERFTKELGADN